MKRIKSWQNLQTLFTFEYLFTLSYVHTVTYIAYEHIHLAPGSCTSVKYTELLEKFCLICLSIVRFTNKLNGNDHNLSNYR